MSYFDIGKMKSITPLLLLIVMVLLKADRLTGGMDHLGKNKVNYQKETYVYKIVDNSEIRANVFRVKGSDTCPALIWIHGGALIIGGRNWLKTEQLELYLQAGFTVISIDYRLAPETKLVEIIEDLQDAYTWVRTKGPPLFKIDPEKIAVVGHSAGGYLTLIAGVCLKPKPNVLVSFYGYGDLTGDWYAKPDPFYNQRKAVTREQAFSIIRDSVITETADEKFWKDRLNLFYLYCRQQGLWPKLISGHDPVSEPAWFKSYEPLRMVTPDYPPTFLLHGEKDTDVPFEQSVLMAEALEKNKIAYEFIRNAGWGHGFDSAGTKNEEVRKAFDQVLSFLGKYLR